MQAHVCNVSTQEATVGELQVLGHPELPSKPLPQKEKKQSELKSIVAAI
jgi:hypothetical protein